MTRQMSAGETNVSEPLMTCRNPKMTPKPGGMVALGPGQTVPADGLSGVRHEDGVTPTQASMRNVGTCGSDAKGELQAGNTREEESTDAGHRGGPTRTSVEVSVMGMERRGWVIWPNCLANQKWEEPEGTATPPGSPERRDGTSRMTGDCHVRICEGLGVRFPRTTRRVTYSC